MSKHRVGQHRAIESEHDKYVRGMDWVELLVYACLSGIAVGTIIVMLFALIGVDL